MSESETHDGTRATLFLADFDPRCLHRHIMRAIADFAGGQLAPSKEIVRHLMSAAGDIIAHAPPDQRGKATEAALRFLNERLAEHDGTSSRGRSRH